MKTLRELAKRTRFNWFYLLLAGATLWASLSISTFKFMPPGLGSYEMNDIRLWLLVATILYLINWFYGVIYFPQKYRRIMNQIILKDNENTDVSFVRGVLPSFVVVLAVFRNIDANILLYLVAALWLAIHAFLIKLCRTDNLFSVESVLIDEAVLMPWLELGDNAEHRYVNMYYIRPVLENKEMWEKHAIVSHASHKRCWYMSLDDDKRAADLAENREYFASERKKEAQATALSEQIYAEIS